MKLLAILIMLFAAASADAANSSRNFGGVGIDGAPWADGRIVVKQVVAGGPAHLAGVKAGDVITHIDGKSTEGSNFKEMVEYRLRGRAGTPVTIVVRRPGETKPYKFTLTRRQLVIPPQQ
jgi:C-terminal processing protease CtpA/Prc